MVRRVELPALFHPPTDKAGVLMTTNDMDRDRDRGQIAPEEREAMRRRAAEIGRQLDGVKAARETVTTRVQDTGAANIGSAFRFTFELLAGVGVGGLVGWMLDRQFNTAPWLMLVCLVLGFIGALVNVLRAAAKDKAAQAASRSPAAAVRDDEDDDR